MCGIAGIFVTSGASSVGREDLEKMILAVRHRGPDGFGYYQDDGLGLAHARLSIIDLATGDQPMANEDQTIWTVFNGEIFNFVELRDGLQKAGHVFRTRSDTETIVHAYEEYGDRFVEHLNGQFAIALWDARRRRLLLARDRLGIRPLFYTMDGSRLLFASEVKSLRAVHSRGLTLDPSGVAQVFKYWSPLGAQTVFSNVSSLPPGSVLVAEGGRISTHCYWDLHFDRVNPVASIDEVAENLQALLIDAVRLQLRSDVPVGAYLSGGLDSSGIVSLIRAHSSSKLRTFSVAFEDSEFDESAHQLEMVRHLGTDHSTIRCTQRDIGELFPRFVWHAETPVVRTAPVPLMMLSGLVRESGFKVVLTGEGADEVFGGYDLFKEGKIRRFWSRQPNSAWRPKLLSRLYPYLRHSPVGSGAFTKDFFGKDLIDEGAPGYAHGARWATTKRLWNFFTRDVREKLDETVLARDLEGDLPPQFGRWEGLARDQYVEFKTLLAGYLLSSQGDRVAMANSVEGRVPFLDHRVVEFAGRLPARYKIAGLTEKAVLKKALKPLLPASIVNRVKQPYRSPDAPSFFRDGQPLDYVAELLGADRIRDAGLFEAAAIGRLFEKCRTGKAIGFSDNMALVGVISTMLVHDQFVRGGRPVTR